MIMWILRTIGWLMIAPAIARLGFRPGPAPAPPSERGSRQPAVDPADVIEAKFRPAPPRPASGGTGSGTAVP
jgi:hypothetical protein